MGFLVGSCRSCFVFLLFLVEVTFMRAEVWLVLYQRDLGWLVVSLGLWGRFLTNMSQDQIGGFGLYN